MKYVLLAYILTAEKQPEMDGHLGIALFAKIQKY